VSTLKVTSELHLEPQRKLVTVLFADVKGSTNMIAGLDPEDALSLLQPVLSAMQEAIHRFDGVVSKEAGDGVMAFFGAPIARDDHAEQACRAALALHEEIATLKQPGIQIRVGVHSGEVVLHQVLHDFSSVYDAAGGVVHIAQKIQSSAEAGGTLVSGDCRALIRGRFDLARFDGELRGLDQPMELFVLKGSRPVSRWEARAAVGLSPFVGRRDELTALMEVASAVRAGASKAIVIEGEPGAGKSRLVHELLTRSEFDDWRIWRANAEVTTRQAAWNIARGLLSAAADRTPHANPAGIRDRLVELAGCQNDLDRIAASSLLGMPVDSAEWAETTPEHRSRLMRDLFARALLGACRTDSRPTALVVEDLHWADTESREAIDRLMSHGGAGALLVLATERPRAERTIAGDIERIFLPPLAVNETNQLLRGIIGAAPELDRLKRRIVEHTGGIPLFVEEVVRQMIASEFLVGSDGNYAPQHPLQQIGIPPTVQGVIASRIDLLSEGARALLQVASVMGNGASEQEILAVREAAGDPADSNFDELKHAALLRAVPGQTGDEILFAHDLIREVAYSGMLRARRRQLHRCALDYQVALGVGRENLLYRHAAGAEDWHAAVGYARRAAAEAAEQSAYWNSLEYSDAAIAALSRLPATEQNVQLQIDLRLEARPAFGATAQLKRLLSYAEDARLRAQSIHDQRRTVAASIQKILALTFVGTPDEALPVADETLKLAGALGAPELDAVTRYFAGQANYMAGNYRHASILMAEASERLPPTMGLARSATTGTISALIKVLQSTSLASMGSFDDAAICASDAARIAALTDRPYDDAACAYGLGYAALLQGRLAEAVEIVAPRFNAVREQDIYFFVPVLGNLLGQAFAGLGRTEEALRALNESQSVATRLSYVGALIGISLSRAVTKMSAGDFDGAEALLRPCLENTRQQGYRGIQANAARYSALLGAKRGAEPAEVEQLFAEAIDVAAAIEARPALALSRLSLAEFWIGTGQSNTVIPVLRQAREEFIRMNMTPSVQRADRVLSSLLR